ncbi:unnamed protein product, partial [marine sediment metagenome]
MIVTVVDIGCMGACVGIVVAVCFALWQMSRRTAHLRMRATSAMADLRSQADNMFSRGGGGASDDLDRVMNDLDATLNQQSHLERYGHEDEPEPIEPFDAGALSDELLERYRRAAEAVPPEQRADALRTGFVGIDPARIAADEVADQDPEIREALASSVIMGGRDNVVSGGTYSFIGGGARNTISDDYRRWFGPEAFPEPTYREHEPRQQRRIRMPENWGTDRPEAT